MIIFSGSVPAWKSACEKLVLFSRIQRGLMASRADYSRLHFFSIRITIQSFLLQPTSSLLSTFAVGVKVRYIVSAPCHSRYKATYASPQNTVVRTPFPRRIIIPRNNPMNSTSLSHVNTPNQKLSEHSGTDIIPNSNRPNSPLPPHVMIIRRMDMEPKELE